MDPLVCTASDLSQGSRGFLLQPMLDVTQTPQQWDVPTDSGLSHVGTSRGTVLPWLNAQDKSAACTHTGFSACPQLSHLSEARVRPAAQAGDPGPPLEPPVRSPAAPGPLGACTHLSLRFRCPPCLPAVGTGRPVPCPRPRAMATLLSGPCSTAQGSQGTLTCVLLAEVRPSPLPRSPRQVHSCPPSPRAPPCVPRALTATPRSHVGSCPPRPQAGAPGAAKVPEVCTCAAWASFP